MTQASAKRIAFIAGLLLVGFASVAFAQEGLEQPRGLGDRPPTPAEQAYIEAVYTEISYVEPNDFARARVSAEIEASLARGEMAPTLDGLPSVVDNSTLQYFPPIRSQGGQGSCTCWASCYYYNTYTQAVDEGYDVSGGDNDHICSPAFMYPLVNGGVDGGSSSPYVMARLNDVGCGSWTLKPYNSSDWISWPSEAAWVNALQNRTSQAYTINGSTQQGLVAIKQHLANGNLAETRFDVYQTWYDQYPADGVGTNNGVYYYPDGSTVAGHGVCIAGYDDQKSYLDHRDGLIHHGAFLVVNSWGPDWGVVNSTGAGSKGFFWVAYNMFLESTFGPYVYYNSDRDDYRPLLYGVAGINHSERGNVTLGGGTGMTTSPVWLSYGAVDHDGGIGTAIDDTMRIAVDLTDGVPLGSSLDVFMNLSVDASASANATVTSADFYSDFDIDGTYSVTSSSDPTITVGAGSIGYVTASLSTGRGDVIYVDASNTGGPWDGSALHPFRYVNDGVAASSIEDTVVIGYGVYDEEVTVDHDLTILGRGWARSVIAPTGLGWGIRVVSGADCQIRDLTVDGRIGSGIYGTTYGIIVDNNSSAQIARTSVLGAEYGIYCLDVHDTTVTGSLIVGSRHGITASLDASGLGITIDRCTVAGSLDGGVSIHDAATIRNTIITGSEGFGIYSDGATADIVFCDVWSNAVDFAGCSAGSGCISADPAFLDEDESYYSLGYGSPCVDSGSTDGVTGDGQTDIGACPAATVGAADADYATIQEAVDAMSTAGGKASVLLQPGVYHNVVHIWGPVALVGESPTSTFIDGNYTGCTSSGIYIEDGATGSAVCGLSIVNRPYSGIVARGHTLDGGPVESLIKNAIARNNANYGIITSYDNSVRVINNTTVNNQYGVWISSTSTALATVTIENNIVTSNSICGVGEHTSSAATVTTAYNDVWNNATDLYNVSGGAGAISQDPAFIDANSQNYHLHFASPCIDAGNPLTDWSKEPSPNGDRVNQGAYGNTAEAAPSSHAFTVTANPPAPPTIASGGASALSASFSDSYGHGAASWSWDDGGAGGSFSPSASVQNPTYTAHPNTTDSNLNTALTVNATCDGPDPLSDDDSTSLTVEPVAHTVTVTANSPNPNIVSSGGSAELSATFSDSRSGHSSASWSWDDGGAGGIFSPSAAVQSPTYTAPANTTDADVIVTLTVTATCDGPSPLSDGDSTTLTVQPVAHTFAVSAGVTSPATVASGGSASLSASFTDSRPAHTIASWSWDDGGAGGGFSPSATVQDPTYTAPANTSDSNIIVNLTVTATCNGPDARSDSDSTTLTVQPVEHALEVLASADPMTVASGGTTSLTANFSDSRSAHIIAAWSWDDGGAGGTFSPSGTVWNPSYTAPENTGETDLLVTLTVTGICNGPGMLSDSDVVNLTVQPVPTYPAPGVLLEVHPNERAPGGGTPWIVGGAPWTQPTSSPAGSYWWKKYEFAAHGPLWIQACAQNWDKTQKGYLDHDDTKLQVNGVAPTDYDGIQSGTGSWQWTGGLESGKRVTLRFLVPCTPGKQVLWLGADESPALWWLKVIDLEPGVIEAF